MGKCKGCGREIIWIMTPSGKAMPCDPELVPYWEAPKAKQKIVTRQGDLVSCELEPRSEKETGNRLRSALGDVSGCWTVQEEGLK